MEKGEKANAIRNHVTNVRFCFRSLYAGECVRRHRQRMLFGNWENTTLASDGYAAFIYQDSGTGFGAWDLVSGASPLTQMNITCIYF